MNRGRQGSNAERELRKIVKEKGFIVIRSAGSLATDIVAIMPRPPSKPDVIFFEVKSTKAKTMKMTGGHGSREQLEELHKMASQWIPVVIAVKWMGRGRIWETYIIRRNDKRTFFKEGEGVPLDTYLEDY